VAKYPEDSRFSDQIQTVPDNALSKVTQKYIKVNSSEHMQLLLLLLPLLLLLLPQPLPLKLTLEHMKVNASKHVVPHDGL